MCIGITRNNSLVGRRARAEAQTSATELVTLYCTWRPSALTTRPHGQVHGQGHVTHFKILASTRIVGISEARHFKFCLLIDSEKYCYMHA